MMISARHVSISLGALEPPLTQQLDDLIPRNIARHFQKDSDAINRLLVRGLLMDGEMERVRLRLIANIQKAAKQRKQKSGA